MTVVISSQALRAADRGHLLAALATFAGKTVDDWLGPSHPAPSCQLPRKWPHVRSLSNSHVVQAVAAAGPNHCIDSWSFLSRSLGALLSGDAHASRHLAYYAQLRAALCILSNLGIGIFNRINFVIDAQGGIQRLDPATSAGRDSGYGTHQIVWHTLMQWVQDPASARTFLELVKVRGSTLMDCLIAIWPGVSSTAIAASLIEAWGLDLKRGEDEHRYRNISSYTPQALNCVPVDFNLAFSFIKELWGLFEPSGGPSDNIDKFLLRSLLWQQHKVIAGRKAVRRGALNRRYDELPSGIRAIASKDFLLGVTGSDEPILLKRARSTTSPAGPLDMIARAVLLVHAGTAFTHSSFLEAGVTSAEDLRPWLDTFAEARGFWAQSSPLSDPRDLWADVEIALIDFASAHHPSQDALYDWRSRGAKGIPIITEAERVALWSLCT